MHVYLAAPSQFYTYSVTCPMHRVLISFVKPTFTAARLEKALACADLRETYCVDSGAHVWLSAYFKKNAKPPLEDVERHLHNFLDAAAQLQKKPAFVVELDLQKIYGLPLIETWRKELWWELEQRTGIRVCYVWHPADGIAKWHEMLADPRINYLGMGSAFKNMPDAVWLRMLLDAYKVGKPVHGFAKVSARKLKILPFYSVDSTSWATAAVWGSAPAFDERTGVMSNPRVGRNALKDNHLAAAGKLVQFGKGSVQLKRMVDRGVSTQDFLPYYIAAAEVYDRFEQWFTAYWRGRGVDWDAAIAART